MSVTGAESVGLSSSASSSCSSFMLENTENTT